MAPRNPFAFLDSESRERTLLLLLLALIRKSGGEVTLDLTDLTSIEDGASFHKYPDDTGSRLVLRYARRGAEAYFLSEEASSTNIAKPRTAQRPAQSSPSPTPRHAIHDDVDLALREEEMATRSSQAQTDRLRQARAEAGAMPWRTRIPQ